MWKLISLLFSVTAMSVSAAQLSFIHNGITTKTLSDAEMLNAPQTEIITELPWIEGKTTFSGVKLSDLFTHANLTLPETITFVALNDYQIDIDAKDIESYQPILANRTNGQPMSIRDKGPFWVIFPLSEFPEIDNTDYHAKMIWQVKEIRY